MIIGVLQKSYLVSIGKMQWTMLKGVSSKELIIFYNVSFSEVGRILDYILLLSISSSRMYHVLDLLLSAFCS